MIEEKIIYHAGPLDGQEIVHMSPEPARTGQTIVQLHCLPGEQVWREARYYFTGRVDEQQRLICRPEVELTLLAFGGGVRPEK